MDERHICLPSNGQVSPRKIDWKPKTEIKLRPVDKKIYAKSISKKLEQPEITGVILVVFFL